MGRGAFDYFRICASLRASRKRASVYDLVSPCNHLFPFDVTSSPVLSENAQVGRSLTVEEQEAIFVDFASLLRSEQDLIEFVSYVRKSAFDDGIKIFIMCFLVLY